MITGKDIIEAQETIKTNWGEDALYAILEAINSYVCVPMRSDEFLNHCMACGGNWGGMLLSGLQDLYPAVWDAVPEDMGRFAFHSIVSVIQLCKVDTSER